MTARNYANQSSPAALSSAVGPSDGTITVSSLTGYPAAPFTAVIEKDAAGEEVVLVTAVAGLVLTVTRGYDGTSAQSHAAATLLTHVVTAIDYREANVHANGTSGSHGLAAGVNLVGDTATQTLTNKTLRLSSMEVNTNAGTAVKGQSTVGVTGYLFRGNNSVADVFSVTEAGNTAVAGTLAVAGATTATGGVTTSTVTGAGARLNLATANVARVQDVTGVTTLVTLGTASTFGSVAATGAVTAATTLAVTGAATFGATAAVTGAVTAASAAVTGAVTAASVTASGAVAGATVAASGNTTVGGTLTSTGNVVANAALNVGGLTTLAGATATGLSVSGTDVLTLPRGLIAYDTRTTSAGVVNAMTVLSSLSVASPATTDLREYKITFLNCGFYCDAVPTAGGFELGMDGANVQMTRPIQFVAAGVNDFCCPVWVVRPTIGAHTFTVYMGRTAGVGDVGISASATNKMELLLEDMGRV